MASYHRPDSKTLQTLRDLADKLRIHSIECTTTAKSGHPTSCCSVAEVMSTLFFHVMKYIVSKPRDPSNDRFVLSKGHACPILYAAWAEAGLFPVSELKNLRKVTSDLEGHPTPRLNFIDVATGSLGQGLSVAVGMAYTGKYFDKASYRVYCLLGDGEVMEGSVWEAFAFGSIYSLDNLVAIIDVNRLGQSDVTSLGHNIDVYRRRAEAFGWNTYVVDGHDVEALCKAFYDASTVKGQPTCIVAQTFKGKGIVGLEDSVAMHGKIVGGKTEEALQALRARISNQGPHGVIPAAPSPVSQVDISNVKMSEPPSYQLGQMVAPRAAYGTALVKLGTSCDRVISLDGDMRVSTHSHKFRAAFPDRFIECYIAEQNLVGAAIGCGTRGRTIPFVSTYGAFLTRAFDQIRMGAVSMTNVNFTGSHPGVSIGEDGPSQMALEDLAMFRAVPGATVFYPSDAVSMERAVELAANTKGICYIRSSRPEVPVIYSNDEPFKIGQGKIVRQTANDKVTVVGAAVTLTEAMKAAEELAAAGVGVRLVDLFTVKPVDSALLIACARETGGRILTVEDHYPEGGLGEAVARAVGGCRDIQLCHLAVTDVPRSGTPAELLDRYGISASCIVKTIKQMVSA